MNSYPKKRYFDTFTKFKNQHGFVGQLLIRGHAEEEDDEMYTEEQMQSLRYVMIDQARLDAYDQMEKLIIGEEIQTSTTKFSYEVLDAYEEFKRMYQRKFKPEQFNLLFTFTYFIKEYDYWMYDHEVKWGVERMITDLAKKWKKILVLPNDELGIDEEYTRPAIQYFLEDFKMTVEDVHMYNDSPFKFKYQ